MAITREIQLGKNGITDNFIQGLKNHFTKAQNIKVSVLRSFCRDKKDLEEIKNKLLENLGPNYTARTIGYTIAFKKWRKARE